MLKNSFEHFRNSAGLFLEIAMMTAIENGFDVPQFSESITDPLADGSCVAGSKEIYFIIQSPFAGLVGRCRLTL